jgi:hypothetical protein
MSFELSTHSTIYYDAGSPLRVLAQQSSSGRLGFFPLAVIIKYRIGGYILIQPVGSSTKILFPKFPFALFR